MYKVPKPVRTSIEVNKSVEGETIEIQMERLLNNNDEIPETKELIFTRQEDGVIGGFDIRFDRWDQAYKDTTVMAEKNAELDNAKLIKRKETLKELKEQEKYLRDQAKEGLKPKSPTENNPGE